MEIRTRELDGAVVIELEGELDAYWADETRRALWGELERGRYRMVLDLEGLRYVSSGGLRVLLQLQQRLAGLDGRLRLAGARPFVRDVLAASGFDRALRLVDGVPEALAELGLADGAAASAAARHVTAGGAGAPREAQVTAAGRFELARSGSAPAGLGVTGTVADVLACRASEARLVTLPLGEAPFTLGVGALGERGPDALERLGEVVILPGAACWLPGDGRQVPDLLLEGGEPGGRRLPVQLLHGLTLAGTPQVTATFAAADPEAGAALGDVVRDLHDWAARQPGFPGLLGIAFRGETAGVWGAALRRSPREGRAPANGQPISSRENVREWLHFPTEAAFAGQTLVGIGLVADGRLATARPELAAAAFGPGAGAGALRAHLHGAVFRLAPAADPARSLAEQLAAVAERGELASVTHLLPATRLRSALLNLWLIPCP